MDKEQKLGYQRDIEKYLENKKVFELFQDLMKSLVINKPSDPLDFIIDKLSQTQQPKKIFLVGPPGSSARDIAEQLKNYLQFPWVSVGELLLKEVANKTDHGKVIAECYRELKYVPDQIVVEVVKNQIAAFDKENKSWIIEGFPKTKVQGLALQRAGIIPDTFLLLNLPDEKLESTALKKLTGPNENKWQHIQDKVKVANDYALEYKMNISHVKQLFKHYALQVDATVSDEHLLEEVAQLVKYKVKSKAPRRAPRIVVVGPPGSNKQSLAGLIAKKYGFVHVNTGRLLSDQVAKHTEIGKVCLDKIKKGELIPDDIMFSLVATRIKQPDCQIHGYVLEGFPKTPTQVKLLEELRISPTVVVVLEKPDAKAKERATNTRLDPITGEVYDLANTNLRLEDQVSKRLIVRPQDDPKQVEKRLHRWTELHKLVEGKYTSVLHKVSDGSEKNAVEHITFFLENGL